MNQLLDSRLQVLAFDYVSFGIFTIVNNLWTWVAVITAALSFWRIRAAGVATSSCSVQSHEQGPSTPVISRPITEVEEKPTVSAPASVCINDGVTKNGKSKLTVYYDDDIAGESNVNHETTETEWSNGEGYCMGGSCGGDWWESWESVLRLRKGETEGWYRYQDLTAVNGNVVRLWDDSCRKGSSVASKPGGSHDLVRSSCVHASYPSLCFRTLSSYSGPANTPRDLAQAAVKVSLSRARKVSTYLATRVTGKSKRERAALSDCVEQMSDTMDELSQTLRELKHLRGGTFGFQMSNAQTWVSAALTNEDTCLDGFEGVDGKVKSDVKRKITNVAKVTSNALYMINRLNESRG
ncbi:hypothetical protein V6N13_144856 [Hibiscus sabdariffa]|uniref:Pectinesterase inhibitor domain-containing protein n=1 Tax=Hibiscus sabdariffa TaxID=183260 RepID=A0ABR2FLM5_9ROSI